jgi:hypothetical protein
MKLNKTEKRSYAMHTHTNLIFKSLFIFFLIVLISPVSAQDVLFDFDNAPLYTSLPIYQTSGGITAHLSATGQGYSIQNANVLGFTPPGFSGHILYPNSISISDIRIHFDHSLTDFSIMYACQELGCDDAATMRVTAYLNGIYVGYVDHTCNHPGTWPVDTLRCTYSQGFDSVIVHYQAPPPTCQDYGSIYVADNMRVTPVPVNVMPQSKAPERFMLEQNYPNPFNPSTIISYQLPEKSYVMLKIFDVLGREVAILVNGVEQPGYKSVNFNPANLASGVYYYQLQTGSFTDAKKLVLLR